MNEFGIYEITFLSHTKKAKEFRWWVENLLSGIRKGELQVVHSDTLAPVLEIKEQLTSLFNKIDKIEKTQSVTKYMVGLLVPPATFSDWKKSVGEKIRDIAKEYGIEDEKKIYNQIYVEMSRNYDTDLTAAKEEYLKIKNLQVAPTIDVVNYFGDLRDLFETLVNNYERLFTQTHKGEN